MSGKPIILVRPRSFKLSKKYFKDLIDNKLPHDVDQFHRTDEESVELRDRKISTEQYVKQMALCSSAKSRNRLLIDGEYVINKNKVYFTMVNEMIQILLTEILHIVCSRHKIIGLICVPLKIN